MLPAAKIALSVWGRGDSGGECGDAGGADHSPMLALLLSSPSFSAPALSSNGLQCAAADGIVLGNGQDIDHSSGLADADACCALCQSNGACAATLNVRLDVRLYRRWCATRRRRLHKCDRGPPKLNFWTPPWILSYLSSSSSPWSLLNRIENSGI